MPFVVDSRRKSSSTLSRAHPGATFVDVTSRGTDPWVQFSPFFPHGGIPIPLSAGTAQSVEGIWQGLKVFERADVDPKKFAVTTMTGLKRTTRAFGPVLGHRAGVGATKLLPYVEARFAIYLPAYAFVLEHRLAEPLARLREMGRRDTVVLLDYETNADPHDPSKPLSHASLVVRWLAGDWPADNRR